MENNEKHVLYPEYKIFLAICLLFVVSAFIFSSPSEIVQGLGEIFKSRGLLLTDYMVVGGIGAAIINSTIVGLYSVLLLYLAKAKPTGGMIMALWMAVGWTYWGAHVFSIMPLTIGCWLYAKFKKRPFSDFLVIALLGETIAPLVSVFYVSNPIMLHMEASWPVVLNVVMGIGFGIIAGFLLPIIAGAATRFHDGYTLYNMGVTGGFIAVFAAGLFKAFGIAVPTESIVMAGENFRLSIYLFVIFASLIGTGLFLGAKNKTNHVENLKGIIAHPGHAPNDYYTMFGPTAYINMGLLGCIGTLVVLAIKAELGGATFACIFSMVAFGCFGKTIYNVLPVMTGAILCAFLNGTPFNATGNILPILFCSCLAPIAGEYGWFWGIVTGFFHVLITQHIGSITNGFNIYNNGFCSGFVAFFIVAVAAALRPEKKEASA
ncbi:MAG: DUF1576 domain-containing protein [Eubacteriaceae bacterium]|nr:DUF1576 domain-containing protein [Eubacteriaceae bacterium]